MTVDPNKAIAVGLTAVQVANEVRTALVPTTATQVTIEDGQPVDLIVQLDPEKVDVRRVAPGAARRHGRQGAAG